MSNIPPGSGLEPKSAEIAITVAGNITQANISGVNVVTPGAPIALAILDAPIATSFVFLLAAAFAVTITLPGGHTSTGVLVIPGVVGNSLVVTKTGATTWVARLSTV